MLRTSLTGTFPIERHRRDKSWDRFSIGAYFFIKASSMPATAGLFPKLVSILVFILSGAMVLMAIRKQRQSTAGNNEGREPASPEKRINRGTVVAYAVAIVAYIYAIPRIGYFVATPLFMILGYVFLRAMGLVRAILVGVGFSIFIYFLFVWFLKLPIPMGCLESLLGS
jgi:hypothetical protein